MQRKEKRRFNRRLECLEEWMGFFLSITTLNNKHNSICDHYLLLVRDVWMNFNMPKNKAKMQDFLHLGKIR